MCDSAISKLSAILHSYATDTCRIYRVGGDEFVSIIDNPEPSQMATLVMETENRIKEEDKSEPFAFSVAVGYALGNGKDIAEIVKKADAYMYENKKESKEMQKG